MGLAGGIPPLSWITSRTVEPSTAISTPLVGRMAMPVTVKRDTLWRKEIENRPGALAAVLAPLAEAGADLQVVMGYRHPGHES